MYIAELFYGSQKNAAQETAKPIAEASQTQLVVLYPGRFQPFHLGHAEVFQSLQSKFGRDNVYIATSNKTDAAKSPFNFTDKTMIMHAAGVPADRILEVQSPYKLPEQFDPTTTILIVAVGAPDAERLRPGSTKKDGNPGYYQTFKSLADCETADKHGYCIIAAERHKVIALNGQQVDVSHGTPSRAAWNSVRGDEKGRAEYMTQMFGRNDPELGRVLDKIPEGVSESLEDAKAVATVESLANPQNVKAMHPTDIDSLITSIGQKAKQGEKKVIWVADQYGKGGRYKVVPAASVPMKEDDPQPLTRQEYNVRRKALQDLQMDPRVTANPQMRKELIKKIAALTLQARSAGALPESTYRAHVQENKAVQARSIAYAIKYLKESSRVK